MKQPGITRRCCSLLRFLLVATTLLIVSVASATAMSSSLLLQGKRILITGAGRGIGRAIAQICYQQGARVALCARTPNELEETVALLRSNNNDSNDECQNNDSTNNRILWYIVDVTQPNQVHDMIQSIVRTWGENDDSGGSTTALDVLINNAGRGQAKKGTVSELDSQEFADLLNLNVVAVHTITAACVPYMTRGDNNNQTAQIINISSKAGKMGLPGMSQYVASKFAVEGLTASWAAELKDSGIRVNSISPGMVNTASFPKAEGRPGVRTAESIEDGMLLLLSDDTAVTGHYLHVDELDMVRARGLPDTRALKPINEPNFADTLETA